MMHLNLKSSLLLLLISCTAIGEYFPRVATLKSVPITAHWKEQDAFLVDVGHLIFYIHSKGYYCTFGEAWRSHDQAEIYAKEGKGIVNSLHCQRLAIDLNLYSKDGKYITDVKEYRQFGEYWMKLNPKNRWGGCFHDRYGRPKVDSDHFERNAP